MLQTISYSPDPSVSGLNGTDVPEPLHERLFTYGPGRLLDEELLALILGGKGDRARTIERCRSIVARTAGSAHWNAGELGEHLPRLGRMQEARILAALELTRRRGNSGNHRIRTPADVIPLLVPFQHAQQEHFLCVSLNGAHEVIAARVVTIGLVDRTQVHPREVFAEAITDRAVGVILAHNHPSGELTPSNEDQAVTKRLFEVGQLLGIKVLDHIIFSRRGFKSLKEEGLM